MDSKVLREEVAGKATKSYQRSPWGQQLTQIKHKDDGTTRAAYGYTAYGSDESGLFTGADKPDAQNPERRPGASRAAPGLLPFPAKPARAAGVLLYRRVAWGPRRFTRYVRPLDGVKSDGV
ncbi:hypothetical protein [Streptomyces sp. NPDC058155]|uniref:hypothetical protein n=1 Tax=Streptomyces sp. NPDC058155 TaxID=3346359 RepID=UPI0036E10E4C